MIHKTKEDYEPVITFRIDVGEMRQLNEWLGDHEKTCPIAAGKITGAIGGALTYSFTNTSLGQICKIRCACGQEVDVTDYEGW